MEGEPPSVSLKRVRSPTLSTQEELADPNTTHTLARKRSASAESFRPDSTAAPPPPPPPPPSSTSSLQQQQQPSIMSDSSVPPAKASVPASRSAADPPSVPPPPGAEQLQKIKSLKAKELVAGDKWFILAKPWYRRWNAACASSTASNSGPDASSDHKDEDEAAITLEDVGPIENASLLQAGTATLSKAPTEGVDAEFLPQEAWHLLKSWYGLKDAAIERTVIAYGSIPGGERIEFFPPSFTLFLACPDASYLPDVVFSAPPTLLLSAGETLGTLRQTICDRFTIKPERKPVKLYRMDEASARKLDQQGRSGPGPGYAHVPFLQTAGQLEPCAAGADEQTLIDVQMDDPVTYLVVDVQPYLLNDLSQNQGSAPAGAAAAAPPPPPDTTSNTPLPINFGSNKFVDTLGPQPASSSSAAAPLQVKYKSNTPSSSGISHYFNNNSSSSSTSFDDASMRMTRSMSQQNSSRTKGLCGLGNLGNTCFMNSALQCLSNTPELREYFNTGAYRTEINRDNPLGMSGKVAEEFGRLIQKLWSGNSSSYTPREFKAMIGRFRPMFIGWSQQDSQELLSFLLDGLHEDLNRIYKKPATTKPEWEGGGDLEMMKMAKESWRLFKLRNDSVIVDLFQGMYRSTVVCPDCKKVSITFDAFTSLTLPLPPREWSGEVWIMPADPTRPRYRLPLRLPDGSTVRKAKTIIGAELGIDPTRLYAVECYNSKIWKSWVDEDVMTQANASLSTRNMPNDYITFYELPFSYDQLVLNRHREESKNMNDRHRDVAAGKIVVPVLLATKNKIQLTSPNFFGLPLMVGLERKDATTYESVEEAVIRQIARLSKNGADFFDTPSAAPETAKDEATDSLPSAAEQTDSEDKPPAPAAAQQSAKPDAESFLPPKLPPKGTPILSKAFNIFVANRRAKNVNVGTATANEFGHGRTKLRDRIKEYAEAAKNDMPGSLPGAPTVKPEDDDEELKKRYEDVQPPSPVIETGDALLVEFTEAAYKMFFGDAALTSHDQAVAAGKPLPPSQKRETVSLDACLDEFSKVEQLDAMNTWYCPQCKDHKEASKQVDLWSLPDILVMHLKRFSASRYGSRDKITDKVDFPLEGLDLAPRVIERKIAEELANSTQDAEAVQENVLDSENLVYDLFAVDNHYGGMGGGHYTTYAKNVEDGKWYDFDDTRVSPIPPEQAKTPAAYLLFYRRRTSRPFGGKTRDVIAEAQLEAQVPDQGDAANGDAAEDGDNMPDLMPDDGDNESGPSPAPSYYPLDWTSGRSGVFGAASDYERSKPQYSSASSSAAQGGSSSPQSGRSSPDALWANEDFVPSSSADSDTAANDSSSDAEAGSRLWLSDRMLEREPAPVRVKW